MLMDMFIQRGIPSRRGYERGAAGTRSKYSFAQVYRATLDSRPVVPCHLR